MSGDYVVTHIASASPPIGYGTLRTRYSTSGDGYVATVKYSFEYSPYVELEKLSFTGTTYDDLFTCIHNGLKSHVRNWKLFSEPLTDCVEELKRKLL